MRRAAPSRARTTGRPARWRAAAGAVLLATTSGLMGGAAAPMTGIEGVVELPPLGVEVAKHVRPWQYLEIPGVEVLSRCSDGTTKDFAESYHRLTQLFRLIVPAEFQLRTAAPRIIILTNEALVAASAREVVMGSGQTVPENVRFMPNVGINDRDASSTYAILNERRYDGDRMVFTESFVRFLLDQRTPPLPAWLKEGVVRLLRDMAFREDGIVLGQADWTHVDATERLRRDADSPRVLLPMSQLFVNELPPASTANAWFLRTWGTQAALFVRWALEGAGAPRRAALWKFVDRASLEPVNEAMFKECFGFGYADARDRLSDYLPVALRNTIALRADKLTRLPTVRLRDATPVEVGRLKGEWERLEIGYVRARAPQFTGKYQEQAHRTLTQAFEFAPQDPRLLAIIGLYEIEVGNETQARPYLEAGFRAKVARPRVYFELARLRYAEARANAAGRDGLLSVAQVNAVLEPLAFGRTLLPPLVENYFLAADAWGHADAALEQRHFGLLEEGLRFFPQSLGLIYKVAVLHALQGRLADSAVLVERGLRLAPPGPMRDTLVKMQTTLAAAKEKIARPAPAATPPPAK